MQSGKNIVLSKQGMSQRQIARTVGVAQVLVSTTYSRFRQLETLKNSIKSLFFSHGKLNRKRQDHIKAQIAGKIPTTCHPELQTKNLQATGMSV